MSRKAVTLPFIIIIIVHIIIGIMIVVVFVTIIVFIVVIFIWSQLVRCSRLSEVYDPVTRSHCFLCS